MTDYINTKPEGIELKTEMLNGKVSMGVMTNDNADDIKENIKSCIADNKGQVVLNLQQDKDHPIKFMDAENKTEYCSTADWNENTEHSVLITDVNDEGVVVSSWGKKYTISFEDLENNGNVQVYSKKYSFNAQQIEASENAAINVSTGDNTNIKSEVNSSTTVNSIESNIEENKSN